MPRNTTTKEGREKSNKYERMYKRTAVGKFIQYRSKARQRGFIFTLTKEEFGLLVSQSCVYCGSKESIGVDRIDNDLGYSIENCSTCCTMCNMMKKNFSLESFLGQCRKITVFNKLLD